MDLKKKQTKKKTDFSLSLLDHGRLFLFFHSGKKGLKLIKM